MESTVPGVDLLPLHLSLAGRLVVVVGGGPVAARKVEAALAARADVHVVAPYVCEPLAIAASAGLLSWVERDYAGGDLDGAWLAVAATGDRGTDEAVEVHATAQRTFCIRADDAVAGTARSPAVIRRGDLVISVGSGATTADPQRTVAVPEPTLISRSSRRAIAGVRAVPAPASSARTQKVRCAVASSSTAASVTRSPVAATTSQAPCRSPSR